MNMNRSLKQGSSSHWFFPSCPFGGPLHGQEDARYTSCQGEDAPHETKDHEPRLRWPGGGGVSGGGKVQGGTRQRFPADIKPGEVSEVAEGLGSEEISSHGPLRFLYLSKKYAFTRRGRVDERVSPQHTSLAREQENPQDNEGASGQPSSSVLVSEIDLTARSTFSLPEDEVRLHVGPACGLEGQVAGPVSVQSVCDLVFFDGHHFLVSTIVDFKPSGITFNEPLVLDFRVGEEEGGSSGDHASNDELQGLKEHKQNLKEEYQVLWRENSADPWELVDKETIDVLHESGKFFVRSRIHHFSQFCLATNVNIRNAYHQEFVPWRLWGRPGRREIQVLNATNKAIIILALLTGFSNMDMISSTDQAILGGKESTRILQLAPCESRHPQGGDICPSDYLSLSGSTTRKALFALITANDEKVEIWDYKVVQGGTRLTVLPGRFSEGMRPMLGTFQRRDLPENLSGDDMVVEAVKRLAAGRQRTNSFVSSVSTTGAVQPELRKS